MKYMNIVKYDKLFNSKKYKFLKVKETGEMLKAQG